MKSIATAPARARRLGALMLGAVFVAVVAPTSPSAHADAIAGQFIPRSALQFAGTASARTDAVATTAIDNVTIEAWVRLDRATGTQIIAYNGKTNESGYGLIVRNGVVQILIGGVDAVMSTKPVDVRTWRHVAGVRESGSWKIYVDGVAQPLSTITSTTTAPRTPTGVFSVGSNDAGTENLAGSIDEIRVWNVARSASQIAANMRVNLAPKTPSLVSYWRLDENGGTADANAIEGGRSLTLTGTPPPKWIPSDIGVPVDDTPGEGDIVEDVPDMSEQDIQQVMSWIRVQTAGEKLPFCWRQTHPRGVGTVPGRVADCPPGYTNNGATCGRGADTIGAPSHLASCPEGYTNTGLTCFRGASTYGKGCTTVFKKYGCREGYTDMGCFCGRGASTLGASAMTCEAGYHKSDITKRCIKDCPPGYTNTGETCFRGASTDGMDAMTCKAGEVKKGARCYPATGSCKSTEEEDAGLCYAKCAAGFHGEGPVCWQDCAPGWAGCAAGCGKTKTDCAMTVADQVLSVLVLAANIATLGLDTPATAGAVDTLKIGGKTVTSSTRTGKTLIAAVKALQSVRPAGITKEASVFRRIYMARLGTKVKVAKTSIKVADLVGYKLANQYADTYAVDFAAQTSNAINAAIDKAFSVPTAKFIKQTWAKQQLAEMSEAHNWNIAQDTMAAVSLVDITGITGVVSAYAQPQCQAVIPMPCIPANLNYPNCK